MFVGGWLVALAGWLVGDDPVAAEAFDFRIAESQDFTHHVIIGFAESGGWSGNGHRCFGELECDPRIWGRADSGSLDVFKAVAGDDLRVS